MIVERIARSIRLLAACGFVIFAYARAGWSQEYDIRMAQEVHQLRAALSPSQSADLRRPAEGVYDLVALRVEFQPDTSRFTTGDGTFDTDLYGGIEPALDPLPHDAEYFQAHLDFLSDYVERVSDGVATVTTHLLPDIVQVPGRMGSYAPTGTAADSDQELSKLAGFVEEAWSIADDQLSFDMSGFAPERTAFVIFHAGVGRDVELIGTTLDKTPEDLPSLYLDEPALMRLGAGDISFNGFAVDHTMILPRTESRLGTDFIADEPFLLELSINGLLAASFFNFLGVPDLFDTATGESAIGPFGLMDPQGIFAYRGLFPPEPMAWTKYFLGWTDPVRLAGEAQTVTLRAASEHGGSESAQAAVSDAEYFLVENRYRDPEHDGLTMRIWQDGSIVEQHVENGDENFNAETIEGFAGGVVVGVDNYDWALPGGLDENDNPLNGGMLIWHVDERRLRRGMPENTVNVGPRSRAIDLEEADSAQDIGFPSGMFGPQAEFGTPFDFYFEGNPVVVLTAAGTEIRLYENRFGPDTHPSSETNAGGPSFIVLEDFSPPAAEMSFSYHLTGYDGVSPLVPENAEALRDVVESLGLSFHAFSGMVPSEQGPLIFSAADQTTLSFSSAATYRSETMPVVAEGRLVAIDAQADQPVRLRGTSLSSGQGASDWSVGLPAASNVVEAVSPVVRSSSDRYYAIFELPGGTALMDATSTLGEMLLVPEFGSLIGISTPGNPSEGDVLVVGRDGAGFLHAPPRWNYTIDPAVVVGRPVFGRDADGLFGVVPLIREGQLLLLHEDGETGFIDAAAAAGFDTGATQDSLSALPILVDLDGDSRLDILVTYASRLLAFSRSGAVVSGFPIPLPAETVVQPLVARFEGEQQWTIFTAARDGYLYAHGGSGFREGFPLEIGDVAEATPLIHDGRLYAVSRSGTIKAWELPGLEEIWWGELYADADNSSFVKLDATPPDPGAGAGLIDASETYNWPNPIEDGTTHLRIRTVRDARVDVTIIDAGGALIDNVELGLVRGGIPTEVAWQADVESGLYYARFTASTDGGEQDTKVVKMAVVR